MNPTRETWKSVIGYEGLYEVSSQGQVRSIDRTVPHGRSGTLTLKGRIRTQYTDDAGRKSVNLSKARKTRTHRVHNLVALAFIGPVPDSMEVCHGNGDAGDNRPENLRYDTSTENAADRERHGTWNIGTRNGQAVLTETDVRAIRGRIRLGETNRSIALTYGVAGATISHIKNRTTWAWLD